MVNTLPRVVVCHPGRQHSHQLAMALAGHGMLSKYITGVPAHPQAMPAWAKILPQRYLQAYTIDIDPGKIVHNFRYAFVRRIANRLCSPSGVIDWGLFGNAMFGRAASRLVATTKPSIVVCYERGALEVFQMAKKTGATTVLDAASFHHSWQDRQLDPTESPAVHARVVQRKDAELELADHVVTVSELARQSYIDAGIPATRITAIPVGVDTKLFWPDAELRRSRDHQRTRFVYVGNASRLKGLDVLDAACQILLKARNGQFDVSLIGCQRLASGLLPQAHRVGYLSHRELATELCRYDVLILPSRIDSFGMVVAEAMGCGLPAIVTENVGAKEMIKPRENGLIVAADNAQALATAMEWFMDSRQDLSTMSAAARKSAEEYDWGRYSERAVAFFSSLRA
jgi:glycosyltransferase involved in cell wall biosynthesis